MAKIRPPDASDKADPAVYPEKEERAMKRSADEASKVGAAPCREPKKKVNIVRRPPWSPPPRPRPHLRL